MDIVTPRDQPEPGATIMDIDDSSLLPETLSVPMDVIALLTYYLAGYMSGRLHIASKSINQMRAFFGKSLRVRDRDPEWLKLTAAYRWDDYPLHRVVPTSDTFNISGLTSFTYQHGLSSCYGNMSHVLSSNNVGEILKQAVSLQYLECEAFALLSNLTAGLTMPNLVHLKVVLTSKYSADFCANVSSSYLFAPKLKTINLEKCNMRFPPMDNYTTLERIIGIDPNQFSVFSTPTGIRFPQLKTLMLSQVGRYEQVPFLEFLATKINCHMHLETFSAHVEIGTPILGRICKALSMLKQLKRIDLQAYWPDKLVGSVLDLLKDHTARIDLRISGSPDAGSAGRFKTSDTTIRRLSLHNNIHSLILANGTFELFCTQTPTPKALSSLKLLDCNVLLTNASTQRNIVNAIENPYSMPQPDIFPNLRSFLLDNSVFHSRIVKGMHEDHPFMVRKKEIGIGHVFSNTAEQWKYDGLPFPLYHILSAPNLEEMGLQHCADVSQFASLLQYIPTAHHARLFPRLMTQFVPGHCCVTRGTCPGLSGNVSREKKQVEIPYGLALIGGAFGL